jgi:hypothetical protein
MRFGAPKIPCDRIPRTTRSGVVSRDVVAWFHFLVEDAENHYSLLAVIEHVPFIEKLMGRCARTTGRQFEMKRTYSDCNFITRS